MSAPLIWCSWELFNDFHENQRLSLNFGGSRFPVIFRLNYSSGNATHELCFMNNHHRDRPTFRNEVQATNFIR